MSEIIKYHNDFNKVKLPSFTELEQDLLLGLMVKLKEAKEKVTFYPNDLRQILKSAYNDKALLEFSLSLKEKFFKADFTIIENIEENGQELEALRTINLFTEFGIYKSKFSDVLAKIEILVNPRFEYILNQLTANFTAFELAEFIALSGKYTKTLYRLLKQYRITGKAQFEWQEFKRIMDIPEKLAMCDIDKRILKPAIKELSKERNLFDQVRVPFRNLAYEKEKLKERGRGGKVSGIIFTFKPENAILQKQEKLIKFKNRENQNQALQNLINQKWIYKDEILQITKIENNSILSNRLKRDENENLIFNGTLRVDFENIEQLIQEVSKRIY